MPNWSSMPWYGQILLLVILAIILFAAFERIILPLLEKF